jgi:hypothetical protein
MIWHDNVRIDRKNKIIYCGDKSHRWQYQGGLRTNKYCSFRITEALLLSGGITTPRLFNLLYDDDPDGGPIEGRKQIDVMLANLKPAFAALGLELRSHRHNSYMVHRLVVRPPA